MNPDARPEPPRRGAFVAIAAYVIGSVLGWCAVGVLIGLALR